MAGHGPDEASFTGASDAELKPHKLSGTLAFMWESRQVLRPTRFAAETPAMQLDYDDVWRGFTKAKVG